VDLDHYLSARHRVVMHIRFDISKTAGWEISHLAFVKAISHTNFEGAGDDRNVFPIRMPVGGDAISIWHLQTHSVVARHSSWIALKYRKLRPHWHRSWCETVGDSIGRECVFRRRTCLGPAREDHCPCAQQSGQSHNLNVSFHTTPPWLNCMP